MPIPFLASPSTARRRTTNQCPLQTSGRFRSELLPPTATRLPSSKSRCASTKGAELPETTRKQPNGTSAPQRRALRRPNTVSVHSMNVVWDWRRTAAGPWPGTRAPRKRGIWKPCTISPCSRPAKIHRTLKRPLTGSVRLRVAGWLTVNTIWRSCTKSVVA